MKQFKLSLLIPFFFGEGGGGAGGIILLKENNCCFIKCNNNCNQKENSISVHSDVYKPISFKLGMMVDTTEFCILMLVIVLSELDHSRPQGL